MAWLMTIVVLILVFAIIIRFAPYIAEQYVIVKKKLNEAKEEKTK